MQRLIILPIVLFFGYAVAMAQNQPAKELGDAEIENLVKKANSAYWNDSLKEAFDYYSIAADHGNLQAITMLGQIYEEGEAVDKDPAKAMEYYLRAAEQGYAPAQNHLGVMYDDGIGTERDYDKALYWYRKAAEQGDTAAQMNLEELEQRLKAEKKGGQSKP